MTILYKPVLIESAEQAEALPVGTIARHDDHMPVEKWRDEDGITHWGYIEESVEIDLLRGWAALVPIEAEEETSVVVNVSGFRDNTDHPYSDVIMDSDGNVWFGEGLNRVDVTEQFNEWAKKHTRTRLVTPWEDA